MYGHYTALSCYPPDLRTFACCKFIVEVCSIHVYVYRIVQCVPLEIVDCSVCIIITTEHFTSL